MYTGNIRMFIHVGTQVLLEVQPSWDPDKPNVPIRLVSPKCVTDREGGRGRVCEREGDGREYDRLRANASGKVYGIWDGHTLA